MSHITNKAALELRVLDTGRTRQWLANKGLGAQHTSLLENYFVAGGYVPAHYHPTEELLVCLEGEGNIEIKGQCYDFSSGCTAIVPAMEIHKIQNTGKGEMHVLGFFPTSEPETIWV